MTYEKQLKTSKLRHLGTVALAVSLFGLLLFFIISSKAAADAVLSALYTCLRSVIPSVFPSMVVSGIIIKCGAADVLVKAVPSFISRTVGVSKNAMSALILGYICGFPVGAKTASELFRRGLIGYGEFQILTAAASLPSPAFIINAVGASMLGDVRAGIFLYLLLVLLSLILCAVFARMRNKQAAEKQSQITAEPRSGFISATVASVTSSATAALNITAYMVFFSTLTAMIGAALDPIGAPEWITVTIGGILEFSDGCAKAASATAAYALPFSALFLGFSGMCVHFQVMAVCPDGTKFKTHFLFSAIRGILAFFAASLVNIFFFGIY